MDSKANTTLIGVFTLAVLAAGFVFIYWLARGHERTDTLDIAIVFSDPVTGLNIGSQVLFNGIKVGDVKRLRFDTSDPRRVIADVGVGSATPIKTDTVATLGFQGLTGVAYVDLSGGSPDAPSIWTGTDQAVIVAQRSGMQDLIAGARAVLGRADETFTLLQKLVRDNAESLDRVVANVETFTGALAENADGLGAFMKSASEAAAALSQLSERLQGIVERGEAIIAAVEPDQVRATMNNVAGFTGRLAARADDVEALITRLATISTDVGGFTARLGTLGDKAEGLLTAVDPAAVSRSVARLDEITAAIEPEQVRSTIAGFAGLSETLSNRREEIDGLVARLSAISADVSGFAVRLPAIGEKADALLGAADPEAVGRAVAKLDAITAAIEPDKVRATVDGFAGLSETLSNRREEIDGLVARLSAISADVSGFAVRLPAIGEKADALLGAADPEAVSRAVAKLDAITAAIEPDKVRATVDGFAGLSETLSNRREEIDLLVARLAVISADVSGFAARLPTLGEKTEQILAAIEPGKVRQSIDDAQQFAAALGRSSDDVDAIVADAKAVTAQFKSIGERADALLAKLDDMAGKDGSGLVAQAQETLTAVRDAARTFQQQAQSIGSNIDAFSDRGLRDLRGLLSEGQRTVGRLDRVISNLERDPSQIIFGGDKVPEYRGNRR